LIGQISEEKTGTAPFLGHYIHLHPIFDFSGISPVFPHGNGIPRTTVAHLASIAQGLRQQAHQAAVQQPSRAVRRLRQVRVGKVDRHQMHLADGADVWWLVDLPRKMMENSSVGMMTFPKYGKIKFRFQTTNQMLSLFIYHIAVKIDGKILVKNDIYHLSIMSLLDTTGDIDGKILMKNIGLLLGILMASNWGGSWGLNGILCPWIYKQFMFWHVWGLSENEIIKRPFSWEQR
jgi:hypothetical protein